MAFNPSSISLSYKKLRPASSQSVVLSTTYPVEGGITLQGVPNWLTIALTEVNGQDYTYALTPKPSIAETLTPGSYPQTISFKYKVRISPFVLADATENLQVTLNVADTILLSLDPTVLNFEFILGGQPPPKGYLSISSENSWSVVSNQSWLTTSQAFGTGSLTIEVNIDVTGLAAGDYTGIIQVDDGYHIKTCTVNLKVKAENTASDYLILSPEEIEFSESLGQPPTKTKDIQIESSDNFNITSTAAWLSFSATSGNAGVTTVTVSTDSTEALPLGRHAGKIVVDNTFTVKSILVVLYINEAIASGIESDGFYFADDRNLITMASNVPNSELVLDFQILAPGKIYNPIKTIPFFRGVGSSILGEEAINLVKEESYLQDLSTRAFVPVVPLDYKIDAYDKTIGTTQQTLRQTFSGVMVLPGNSPAVESYLSDLPSDIFTPKNGIVSFTIRADQAPQEILVSGDATANYNVGPLTGNVFTCWVNLSELNLLPGQKIAISFGGFVRHLNILPTHPETTSIIWLNEWMCPEVYNAYGDISEALLKDNLTARYAQDGRKITRTIKVNRPQEYAINTGFIYTQNEADWVAKVLRSRKIWIRRGGVITEVLCTNNELELYRTRGYLRSYLLNFEKAII